MGVEKNSYRRKNITRNETKCKRRKTLLFITNAVISTHPQIREVLGIILRLLVHEVRYGQVLRFRRASVPVTRGSYGLLYTEVHKVRYRQVLGFRGTSVPVIVRGSYRLLYTEVYKVLYGQVLRFRGACVPVTRGSYTEVHKVRHGQVLRFRGASVPVTRGSYGLFYTEVHEVCYG